MAKKQDGQGNGKIPYHDLYFSGRYDARTILRYKRKNDRRELARTIADVTPISFAEALQAVDALFLGLVALLMRDGHVLIQGFGEFYLRYVEIGKLNPTYRNHIRIKFKPTRTLREKVNHDENFKNLMGVDLDLLKRPVKGRYKIFTEAKKSSQD